jgi:hypothetical protein
VTTVRLPEQWSERLIHLPESGMGYQRVNIVLKEGKVLKNVTVLNAEECQVSEPFEPSDIVDVQLAR